MIAKFGLGRVEQAERFDQPDLIPFDGHPAKPILEGSKSSTLVLPQAERPPAEAIVSLVRWTISKTLPQPLRRPSRGWWKSSFGEASPREPPVECRRLSVVREKGDL
jgi:hypothetical protein